MLGAEAPNGFNEVAGLQRGVQVRLGERRTELGDVSQLSTEQGDEGSVGRLVWGAIQLKEKGVAAGEVSVNTLKGSRAFGVVQLC